MKRLGGYGVKFGVWVRVHRHQQSPPSRFAHGGPQVPPRIAARGLWRSLRDTRAPLALRHSTCAVTRVCVLGGSEKVSTGGSIPVSVEAYRTLTFRRCVHYVRNPTGVISA